ncbi:MAG TPA: hypothetical protein PKA19_02895 [Bacillota bacterium]|nr:hypothetical protein [Bacillota bacterium]
MGDRIVGTLDGYKDADVEYKFISKNGMRLEFEVTGPDSTLAVDITKKLIRDTDFGNALYFQVVAEER